MSSIITQEAINNYSQKSEVESRVKSYFDFVTGSAGGWPNKSRAALLFGMDFTIESGSGDIYFFETNTNLYSSQIQSVHPDFIPSVARYAATQSYDNVIVYGSVPGNRPYNNYLNPPIPQRPYISSSFALHNISCSFNDTADRQYTSMRGSDDHANTFHFFHSEPNHKDDNLWPIISGSYDKADFKRGLELSPVSSSSIPTYDSSSKTAGEGIGDWPDYISKTTGGDASFQVNMGGSIFFNSYRSDLEPSSSMVWNWLNVTGSEGAAATGKTMLSEKYIVASGSTHNGKQYSGQGRALVLSTPEENKIIFSFFNPRHTELIRPDDRVDGWAVWPINPYTGYSSISGSEIRMYDGSVKEVQDVEVGDVVKSFQPVGMPNTDQYYLSYNSTSLTGSFFSGSVVTGTDATPTSHYYTISGSNDKEYTIHQLGSIFLYDSGSGDYRFKLGWGIDPGDRMFDKDGNQIEVVSVQDNFLGSEATFYSLDVEDVDTYFSSDILVHNIPKK